MRRKNICASVQIHSSSYEGSSQKESNDKFVEFRSFYTHVIGVFVARRFLPSIKYHCISNGPEVYDGRNDARANSPMLAMNKNTPLRKSNTICADAGAEANDWYNWSASKERVCDAYQYI